MVPISTKTGLLSGDKCPPYTIPQQLIPPEFLNSFIKWSISTTSTIARWKTYGELKGFHLWRKLLFKLWAFQAYLGTDCRSVLHRLHRSTTAESSDTDLCSESKSDELSTGSRGLDPRVGTF